MTTFSSLATWGCFRTLRLYLCWCHCLKAYAQDASEASDHPLVHFHLPYVLQKGPTWSSMKASIPPLDLFYIYDFLHEITNFIKTTMSLSQNYQQQCVADMQINKGLLMNEIINYRTSSFYFIATWHQTKSLKKGLHDVKLIWFLFPQGSDWHTSSLYLY